jgi:hypothetical protein
MHIIHFSIEVFELELYCRWTVTIFRACFQGIERYIFVHTH